jgi:hypothetical protein
MLAAAILLATVLYLVDKNQKWSQFWKCVKWGAVTAVIGCALFFGYETYMAKAQAHTIVVDPSEVTSPSSSPAPATPAK